jgi:hypothetical protein
VFFDKIAALNLQLICYDYPYLYKLLIYIYLDKFDQCSDIKWPIPPPIKQLGP